MRASAPPAGTNSKPPYTRWQCFFSVIECLTLSPRSGVFLLSSKKRCYHDYHNFHFCNILTAKALTVNSSWDPGGRLPDGLSDNRTKKFPDPGLESGKRKQGWRANVGIEPTEDDSGRPPTGLKPAESTSDPYLPKHIIAGFFGRIKQTGAIFFETVLDNTGLSPHRAAPAGHRSCLIAKPCCRIKLTAVRCSTDVEKRPRSGPFPSRHWSREAARRRELRPVLQRQNVCCHHRPTQLD